MKKRKTKADPGESGKGESPPSAPRIDRRKKKDDDEARESVPKIKKKDVGSGGRKALH